MQVLPQQPQGLGINVRVEAEEDDEARQKTKEKDTVRWVLGAPRRLQALINEGQEEQADKEWAEVSSILDKWKNVPGVKELKEECEQIMKEDDESE